MQGNKTACGAGKVALLVLRASSPSVCASSLALITLLVQNIVLCGWAQILHMLAWHFDMGCVLFSFKQLAYNLFNQITYFDWEEVQTVCWLNALILYLKEINFIK